MANRINQPEPQLPESRDDIIALTDAIVAYTEPAIRSSRMQLSMLGIPFTHPVPAIVSNLYYSIGLSEPYQAQATNVVVTSQSEAGMRAGDADYSLVRGSVHYDDGRAAALSPPRIERGRVFHGFGLVSRFGAEDYIVDPIEYATPGQAVEIFADCGVELPHAGRAGAEALQRLYFNAERRDRVVTGAPHSIGLQEVQVIKNTTVIKPSAPDALQFATVSATGRRQSSIHLSTVTLLVDDFSVSPPARTGVTVAATEFGQYPIYDSMFHSQLTGEISDPSKISVQPDTRHEPLQPTPKLVQRLKGIVDVLLDSAS